MTNPRELVERLREGAADLHGFCVDEVEVPSINVALPAYLREAATALSAALDREERLEAENTRLRDFITALEDGNMTFLCDQLDRAKEENTRLRGLLEEAREVLGSIASKNHPSTVKDGIKFTPDAACLARSLLKRLDDPSGQ